MITRLDEGQETHPFPMGALWDSARAAHAVLGSHTFVELCPWADLANEAQMVKAIRTAVSVIADPSSLIYQGTGPHTVLLDRLTQWLTVPDAAGRNRSLAKSLCGEIQKIAGIAQVLHTAAERLTGPPLGELATSDPIEMMRQWRRASPGAPWADDMQRYLLTLSSARRATVTQGQAVRGASAPAHCLAG